MSHSFYSPEADLLVDAVPKCGLNTVAASIIYLGSNVIFETDNIMGNAINKDLYHKLFHNYKKVPENINPDRVLIVRNPFTRGLSALSNKNQRVLKDTIKGEFLSYEQFKQFLNRLHLPEHMNDHHFSPIMFQIKNIEKYKKIFYLENINEFYDYLGERAGMSEKLKKLKTENQNFNFSNSSRYDEYLTDEVVNFYCNFYKKDFESFCYSKDVKKRFLPGNLK